MRNASIEARAFLMFAAMFISFGCQQISSNEQSISHSKMYASINYASAEEVGDMHNGILNHLWNCTGPTWSDSLEETIRAVMLAETMNYLEDSLNLTGSELVEAQQIMSSMNDSLWGADYLTVKSKIYLDYLPILVDSGMMSVLEAQFCIRTLNAIESGGSVIEVSDSLLAIKYELEAVESWSGPQVLNGNVANHAITIGQKSLAFWSVLIPIEGGTEADVANIVWTDAGGAIAGAGFVLIGNLVNNTPVQLEKVLIGAGGGAVGGSLGIAKTLGGVLKAGWKWLTGG